MMERLMICFINIFCPPVSVMLVAGVGTDCLINTLLFIAGVIPGHIHGFYITCTYFHRKRKVRKGRYPGGPKPLIYSERVWNGGASRAGVNHLWHEEQQRKEAGEMRKVAKRTSQRSSFMPKGKEEVDNLARGTSQRNSRGDWRM